MASASKVKKTVRIASGRKRVRQDVKLNAANTSLRSKFRTAVKSVLKAVATGDKAKAILGWEPEVDFEEGLRRTLEHVKAQPA